ncbi:MAG: AsmA family protein [Acidobacteria bacterium]|nr:AsmA family protein [Acidobacteriota bacterium]MBI3664453.1 AsmA family protein [Acidobacteriota bacterium]
MHATEVKRIPRWARFLLALVVLILLVGLVAPYFLDADRYRSTIASAIQEQTGRAVTIGKIRARLLPRVGFVIENFTLGNPAGFAEGNLLAVDAIRGGLSWGPLLSGELQLHSVVLVHPRLVLLEDDRGQTNYDFPTKKKSAVVSSSSGFRLADIAGIRLTDVDVTLARVTGRKRAIVPFIHVTNLSADLGDVALDATRVKQWSADADLAGVRGELSGIRGQVEFRSGEFQLRKGAIESKFEGDLGKVARVKGNIRVADIEKGVAEFELSTALLDLDQVLAVTESTPSVPAPAGKSELIARGRLAADRIRFAPYEATGAKAEMRVFTDRVEIWPVTMVLYGGSLGISARADKRQSPMRFSANIEARSIDVGKMLASAPGTRGKITGTGELTLQVFGSLGSAVLNSLTGAGNFAVRDGRLPSFNLGGAAQALAKVQQILTLGQGGLPSGETSFSAITGDLALGGGRISSNRIHVDASVGTVDMRGSFGFDQTLSYDGQAVLIRSSSGGVNNPVDAITTVLGGVMKQTVGRITVPFAIRGTFANPKIQPGRGIPTISTAPSPGQQQPAQQQPPKKKSIFDIFKKP